MSFREKVDWQLSVRIEGHLRLCHHHSATVVTGLPEVAGWEPWKSICSLVQQIGLHFELLGLGWYTTVPVLFTCSQPLSQLTLHPTDHIHYHIPSHFPTRLLHCSNLTDTLPCRARFPKPHIVPQCQTNSTYTRSWSVFKITMFTSKMS